MGSDKTPTSAFDPSQTNIPNMADTLQPEALLPCPFCGSADVECRDTTNDTWKWAYQVACNNCGSRTGLGSHKSEVVNLWNVRAQPATQLSESDSKWLTGWLAREKDGGHCGEGTFERRERANWNERIDRIILALTNTSREG